MRTDIVSLAPADYSERDFWRKLTAFGRAAGRDLIERSLWLYYAADAPDTPKWAKATVYGSLAYFILPVDAVPDIVPAAGFSDDLTVLVFAVTTIAAYIDADVKARASRTLARWFNGA